MYTEEATAEERPDFLERHYRIPELAKAWRMSERVLRVWFRDEVGVIKFGISKLTRGRERTYVSLRIPESVARRVYRERTGQEIRPTGVSLAG